MIYHTAWKSGGRPWIPPNPRSHICLFSWVFLYPWLFTPLSSCIFAGLLVSLSAQQQSPLYFWLNVCIYDCGAAGCSHICHSQSSAWGLLCGASEKVLCPWDSAPHQAGRIPSQSAFSISPGEILERDGGVGGGMKIPSYSLQEFVRLRWSMTIKG